MKPGDLVTLNCEVKESSTGWRFSWYKTVPYRAGLPSLLDKSYSVKPLSGNGATEESYTLSPAGPTYTGGYVCRAGRGDPVYCTDYSEPQFLWSGDLQPSWSLRINPNTTQHFSSKSLSLTCDLKGKSSGWRLMRYTETGVESGCSPNWGSITGSTCTITSTDTGDSGVYWCESGSGQYSNAVNITVSDGDVILESPAHLVTEGDSLTLRCKCRNQRSTNYKVDFYKDGGLIRQERTGEMTISAVMKSDEGFYKCNSDQRDSPESWVTVRGSPSNRIFWPIHPQSTNQDPQQDQGSTQVQSPDAGYTGVAEILLIHKRVGESVELPGHSEEFGVTLAAWTYQGKEIAEHKQNVTYPLVSQFEGRLEMNPKNFSLTVRDLTLQDSGVFILTSDGAKGQIPSKSITLKVHEPVSNLVIYKKIQQLANRSCSVQMMCNASSSSNLNYIWKRGNEMYRGDQQMQFILSPGEGDHNLICNASNIVSEQSASTTVSCSNETNPTETLWYIGVGIPVGGAVAGILIVAVVMILTEGVVVYKRKDDQMEITVYTDVGDIAKMKDTRSNSDVNPMSIYETVDDQNIPRLNPQQTV
ncbi:uncharacterized protein LOC105009346 isoform X3 [Esox lucius]|uniref:uncharacterized protein LOC105009346 isoform X3 n=1 Tax=Esox lucius TaxID=8010 RepID=UPI0014768ADE|nr:uncharacterized protein LOC105009346 isoform X3 [Esox lucius]